MKKLTKWIFILSVISLCISCNDDETQLPLEGKTYYHSFVSTAEECDDLLRTFGINCFQSIEFLDESTATVVVTDIITPASYCTYNNLIIVTIRQHAELFEAENPMTFLVNEDFTELIRVSADNQVWESFLPWLPRDD